MRHRTPEEQARLQEQYARVNRCLADLERFSLIDRQESEASRESLALSNLSGILPELCEAGQLRVASVIRIMQVIIDIQEEIIVERKLQLAMHSIS
jgi:hypothetical protein